MNCYMKIRINSINIFFYLTTLVLSSCSMDGKVEDAQSENEMIINDTPEEEAEVVDQEQQPNNDWADKNLKARVKSIAKHSVQIDENGEEFGMGGAYEGYEFNEMGFIVMLDAAGCCGAFDEEVEYKYNDKGQLTHRIFRQTEPGDEIDNDHFEYKEKYFYNEDGILVKKKVAGEDQQLVKEHEFTLNEEGKLIEEIITDIEEARKEIITYSYEDKKVTRASKSEDNEYKEVEFKDENGNTIRHELHLNNGNIQETKYTYSFDEKGNWIKREALRRYVYPDGKKEEWSNSTRETRTIVYF